MSKIREASQVIRQDTQQLHGGSGYDHGKYILSSTKTPYQSQESEAVKNADIAGFGLSLCYVAAIIIVAYYFDRKRSFATGVSVCGSGVGT